MIHQAFFAQLDQGHYWQRINGFGAGLIAVKRDSSYRFFGDSRVGFLGLGNAPRGQAKSLFPCGVEPWAFDENADTSLLLAKDGTLWSLGQRIGIDEAILVNAKNTRESILGDRWPESG